MFILHIVCFIAWMEHWMKLLSYVVGTFIQFAPFGIYNKNIDINVLLKVLNVFKKKLLIFPL
jgi:hypothetical protein